MGRKKIEFTTEQDVRITQMVNDGYSLNQMLPIINDEFNTSFSRSCIDRRIKSLGIDRTNKKDTEGNTVLDHKLSNRIEELCEWKRRQSNNRDTITEEYIANQMGISVKTLNKMYKKFDIPKRLWYVSRPDIYFNVKDVVDCTTLRDDVREWIYFEIMKQKPEDMRVERNVVIHTDSMTIKFDCYNDEINKYFEKTVDMDGVDLKVDFYFPDYKTGFYYDNFFYFKSLSKYDNTYNIPSFWNKYLKEYKNGVKLLPVVPITSLKQKYIDIDFMVKSMIDRSISGEYSLKKYVESLGKKFFETEDSNE